MKKAFLTLLYLCCTLVANAQYSGSGSGTASDPYKVFNAVQLAQMTNFLNKTDVVFELKSNIDLTEFIADSYASQGWSPIGTKTSPFKGTLKGNGYTISGLKINRATTEFVGLFGYLDNARLENFTLSLGGSVTGKNWTGALLGFAASSTISNVSILGQSYKVSSNGDYTGGLAGVLNECTVENSIVAVEVSANRYVGGIVGLSIKGSNFSKIENLKDVSGTEDVGGICGRLNLSGGSVVKYHTFSECVSKGNVMSTGDHVGGIVGFGTDLMELTNCYQFGSVRGSNHVGGVLGRINSEVNGGHSILSKCLAVGAITGNDYVGGLAGSCGWNVDLTARYSGILSLCNIENSYFRGSVTGNQYIGGLAGYKCGGFIQKCYSNADVTGVQYVGGLVGQCSKSVYQKQDDTDFARNVVVDGTVSASYIGVGRLYGKLENTCTFGPLGDANGNLVGSKVRVVQAGVEKTIADDYTTGATTSLALLKLKATYVAKDWDFASDWTIQETESYPYMSSQAAPPVIESVLASGASSVSGKSVNGGMVYLYSNNSLIGSANCSSGNTWTIQTSPLQSGAELRVHAEVAGLYPSYYNTGSVTFSGQGTEDNPFKIYTAADLQGMLASGYYKLMNDINLASWISANSATKGWVSVGASGLESVHLDGDGHTISGLWINSTDDYTGLFGHFSDGSIKNLTIEVASGKQVNGGKCAGILVGHSKNSTIKDVTVKGDVTGNLYVGGVSGYSEECTLSSIKYEGSVTTTAANARVGGVAGYAYKCTSTGLEVTVIVGATSSGVRGGGAFGMTNSGMSLTKSIVNANVNLTGADSYAGGLVGYAYCTMSQCVTTGTVRATGTNSYAGGIVGLSGSKITNSYSSADVEASLYVGGIAGSCLNTINNCYANGNLSGLLKGGGIVADLDGSRMSEGSYIPAVTNCVAANNKITLTDQSSWASRVIGGYRNGAADPDNCNYALSTMQVTLNGAAIKKYDDLVEGVAKTLSELQSDAFYRTVGWNMDDVWTIAEGAGYPTLRFENPITPDEPSTDPDEPSTDPDEPSTDPENPTSDIEASTDISTMDYVLYFNDVEAKAGDFNLDLNMKCADEDITAFQCDIYLPEGIEWKYTTDKRGKVIYDVPAFNEERTDDSYHTITPIAKNADGSYKIIVYSMQKDNILEMDGAIMTLPLTISEEMEAGDYNISVCNIVLTDVNTQQKLVEKVVSKLTIPSYQMGDANGDGMINVTDIVSMISHILGELDSNFIFAAADVNGDETINVTDIVGVIDIILNANPADARAVQEAMTMLLAPAGAPASNLQIIPFTVAEGTKSVTAKLNMNNPGDEFTAFQCEVEFPEGIAWASTVDKRGNVKYTAPTFDAEADRTDASYHTVEVGKNASGNMNIFVYSMQKEVILDEEGAVLDLPFTLEDNLAPGIYDIKIKNVVMTRINQTDCKPADYTLSIMVGSPEQPAIVLNGNFTSEAIADFNAVLSASTAISSIDLTAAYDVNATSKIETGNKNAVIYVADGVTTANTANLVADGVCSNLVVTDGYDFLASKAFTATAATYERTLASEWGTIMLPYSVNSTSDVQYYALADIDLENGVLSFEAVSSVEANAPAVFKAAGSKLTQNATNVSVPASVAQVTGDAVDGLTLTGTLVKTTLTGLNPESSSKTYYIKDDAFWCGNGTLNIPAFCAYFDAEGVNARVLSIAGEETGIDSVRGGSDYRIYTVDGKLMGTDVKAVPAGLYIVNDKKVIIKK